jgi:hypothetical protein
MGHFFVLTPRIRMVEFPETARFGALNVLGASKLGLFCWRCVMNNHQSPPVPETEPGEDCKEQRES